MRVLKPLVAIILWLLPWRLRRILLMSLWGYKIHKNARIGFSVIIPDHLEMEDGAKIGHLNFCKGLHCLHMAEQSIISTFNWITGMPRNNKVFFLHRTNRNPSLYIGKHSAITTRHYIDCTDEIRIGDYTTVAGLHSQLLTHSINLYESRQDCHPISIGNYCFVGTNSVFLPGSSLGNYTILAASSLLNKQFSKEFVLLGGVPAKPIQDLSHQEIKYFSRETGFIH